jgi:hypothetical protein
MLFYDILGEVFYTCAGGVIKPTTSLVLLVIIRCVLKSNSEIARWASSKMF